MEAVTSPRLARLKPCLQSLWFWRALCAAQGIFIFFDKAGLLAGAAGAQDPCWCRTGHPARSGARDVAALSPLAAPEDRGRTAPTARAAAGGGCHTGTDCLGNTALVGATGDSSRGAVALSSATGAPAARNSTQWQPEQLQAGSGTGASRALASSETTHAEPTAHASHPQNALFFLFISIVVGNILLQMTLHPTFCHMQQTVALFFLGVVCSLIFDGLELSEKIGVFGESYDMWMDIDPHLLLLSMLPLLLTGDAMTIDTSVARRVSYQCMYLAGPGVLVSAFATALFLWWYLPYEWPFLLCLTMGAILAATDPVAVVSLLKELGASPTLTVQIQGESLLNDGTAIVLYNLAYEILKGKTYTIGDGIIFLVKTVGCAVGLGVVCGGFFYCWIYAASKRLEHHAGMLQTSLTLCCAYWSFLISEGWLHISGVLCTVTAALVLADKMWPVIVDKESMHHVWHMFEYLGNTVIFFLAGALTGGTMIKIPWMDYLHLLVIYVFATVVRGTIIIGSRPLLTHLSHDKEPVSLADCLIMTWGGLRGAVGLALAIQVSIDRGGGELDELTAHRVLFYTGGIASLTLLLNALTCPLLVQYLGITKSPAAKRWLMLGIHHQLENLMKEETPGPLVEGKVLHMLEEAQKHISAQSDIQEGDKDNTLFSQVKEYFVPNRQLECHSQLLTDHETAVVELETTPKDVLKLLDMPGLRPMAEAAILKKSVAGAGGTPNPTLVQAINEAFLKLLRAQYWVQIEAGEFASGTRDVEILLNSVQLAFKHASKRLADFDYVLQQLGIEAKSSWKVGRLSSKTKSSTGKAMGGAAAPAATGGIRGSLQTMIASTKFSILMSVLIIVCSVFIIIEQATASDETESYGFWFGVELFFNGAFTAEFIVKLLALGYYYFLDGWNIFDFVLVLVGIAGMIFEIIMGAESDGDVSTKPRLFRVNRVFRVLRIVRVLRLLRFFRVLKARLERKNLSVEIAEHLQLITVLRAFTKAHFNAQGELLRFLGNVGECQHMEEALTILQSQIYMSRAMVTAVSEASKVQRSTLLDMQTLRESIRITERFEHFIMSGHKQGILNAREAACIIQPLHKGMRSFNYKLSESTQGIEAGAHTGRLEMSARHASDVVADCDDHTDGQIDPTVCTSFSAPISGPGPKPCNFAKVVPEG
mmetsp:Transcript_11802/g.33365  ORF Transcript_11802/g.33365 Transcript_11802/m.33365 type:complete len:1161 (+) Transcript_11802:66-3548(+)